MKVSCKPHGTKPSGIKAQLLGVVLLFSLSSLSAQEIQVPSPEEFFGFEMGADRKLARWDKLVEYYQLLGHQSPRLEVIDMGPTTLGNPFLALYFSSPENLNQLEQLRQLNLKLSDPRGVPDNEIEAAIELGKAVVVQSMCLHSTEVASSQTAAELAYDTVVRNDTEMQRILDNVISIMIPCFNPDGEIMVTDWYNDTVGTDFEGSPPPGLYHHYIGHDNNRDAFMQNTVESQYGAQILFRDWIPQAYVDHHQMGAYTARIYLPPYAEPIRPEADPLVWREMSWFGAHMAYKQEEEDLAGAVNSAIYSGWGHMGFHWITPFHNIAGMLTESASANLATPLYVQPEQLRGSRQLPEYEAQTTFPNPWGGGWWTVRDIVVRQKSAYMATLDIAASNRESLLRNAYRKAKRQTQRGAEGEVKTFVIPAEQHDSPTMLHMVNKLLGQGIEVMRSDQEFVHEGRVYGAGSYVVSMAQPKRGVIRWLLGQTYYPDNSYTRDRDNNPIRPYDMSTDNLAEFMGVRVDPVSEPIDTPLTLVSSSLRAVGTVQAGTYGYRLDGSENASFKAANQLFANGVEVQRSRTGSGELNAGDFTVSAEVDESLLDTVAAQTSSTFHALNTDPGADAYALTQQRVGMYQRYYGGNMDEGWTRWMLEDFEFPYTSLFDADILESDLNARFDVIILPDDSIAMMTGDRGDAVDFGSRGPSSYPAQYRSGFGDEGVEALKEFVRSGGTLVSFARAGSLILEKFELPVRNAVAGLASAEFWSPGSSLKIDIDNQHGLAYGMPDQGLAIFTQGNQVYEVIPGSQSQRVRRVASYIDRDILTSGWLLGEEHIANKAAMIEVEMGEGKVVMIGFRAQHRSQTHGTFKLVFNSMMARPD